MLSVYMGGVCVARSSEQVLQQNKKDGIIMSRAYAANAEGGMVRMAWLAASAR